ncbi:hypothetical protein NHP190012_16770 (plasmid) [Helicobacter sp. NHP19-012]|uniref:beta-lactamase n=1 Tax=Helicobacter gastrofelis TaxID=2849642 RepID=A0ABM7SGG6_9HELI|nr:MULTISPECIES: sel1 repeat family protein [unclassified Helicobacter]BCZ20035.1 hypothetical protein NHP190012_16770 [Helicobacter sp. NHP19-012]GMB96868.1 hypothetical protein NHP22001_14570 [Helicobacter sp. NHP22-001]
MLRPYNTYDEDDSGSGLFSLMVLFSAASVCETHEIQLSPDVQKGLMAQSEQQYKQAFDAFLAADRAGDMFGSALLGGLYAEGKGVEKNTARAETYFNKVLSNAAVKDSAVNYKTSYYAWHGADFMHSSVALARITARLGLAQIYEKTNPKESFKLYRLILRNIGANWGTTTSGQLLNAVTLGFGYSMASRAINLKALDPSATKDPYAKQLISIALYKIGMAYKEGRGTHVKRKKAIEFLEKARDFGNQKAIEALRGLL